MTQAPTQAPDPFRILLIHDGELGFVRALLGELACDFEERIGQTTHEDRHSDWNLVVGNTTRMRELPVGASAGGVRVAVLNDDSRTLRAMLRRMGVSLMVRQPVHPAAFRLLMLHALYRGPERRRASRASVGGPVRVRLGLRRRAGVLLDLSKTGSRVLLDDQPGAGKRIRLSIPPELAGGKKLTLKGTTVRAEPEDVDGKTRFAVGIVFDKLKDDVRTRLHSVLMQHVHGPAVMKGGHTADEVEVKSSSSVAPPRPRAPRASAEERVEELKARQRESAGRTGPGELTVARSVALVNGEQALPPSDAAQDARTVSGDDRRRDTRRSFERRVIVLSDEAARVLLGRDLAAGGMRVGADADLVVGDRLRIALHVRSGEVPLVVKARVTRDDGERGMILNFEDLSEADRNYLEKMVQSLPVVCGGDDGAQEDGGVVVTEILERN